MNALSHATSIVREVVESPLWLRVLILLLAIAQAVAPFIAGVSGHGRPIGSAEGRGPVETPLVPAGYAFSIWGLIFLGCLVLSVIWLSPARSAAPGVAAAAPWVASAFFFCTLWSVVAQFGDLRLTLPVFVALLASLLIALRAYTGAGGGASVDDRLTVVAPLAVFAGWCSVAIFANASTVMVALWRPNFGLSTLSASMLLLGAGTIFGAAVALKVWSSWWTFGAAAWALVAIAVVNLSNPTMGGLRQVGVAAIGATILLAGATALGRARAGA